MPERQAQIEKTLDEKVSALLTTTAKIAANDARDEARRRAWWVTGVVLTLVLGGLVAIQVQLVLGARDTKQTSYVRCNERNRQAQAIVGFIKRAQTASEANPETTATQKQAAREFYDQFLQDFGPLPDCEVYKR